MIFIVLFVLAFVTACGHPKPVQVSVPPPPPPVASSTQPPQAVPAPAKENPSASRNAEGKNSVADHEDAPDLNEPDLAEPTIPSNAKPIVTESGLASWYGPPYHNRRGSNGEVYNMHAMTAAHRTLPLGSIVRVTNVKTGSSALVRITDRGPFIPGRVVDLSLAAARKVDVWRPGVAEVKVDVMETPAPLDSGGKWAVQIGAFDDEKSADKLADHLTHRYRTANVLRFPSPAGNWWIRVRVLDDDRDRAQKLAAETKTPEGAIFLVRLD